MSVKRQTRSGGFKAKVALEAIKGQRTVNEIASDYDLHPNQVTQWKKQALDQLPELFGRSRAQGQAQEEELKARLYQEIGQLKVELDWLKKKCGLEYRG
jgi:transposase-like protein